MGESDKGIEKQIKQAFPLLNKDADFKLTSPPTPKYNCIAWAYNYNDRWMWPGGVDCKTLDGFHYWPEGASDDTDVDAFVEAFKLKGYEICDSWEHEDNYQKIALYVKDGKCTHASRELVASPRCCGRWTSKLGQKQDIQHGSPYTIEGSVYGKVSYIMKRKRL